MLRCIGLCLLVQSLYLTQLRMHTQAYGTVNRTDFTHITQIMQYKYRYMNRQKFSTLND